MLIALTPTPDLWGFIIGSLSVWTIFVLFNHAEEFSDGNVGAESGVCVTLINYPRFSTELESLERTAIDLGHRLCADLCQGSFTIEGPTSTRWFSRRDQDQMETDQ